MTTAMFTGHLYQRPASASISADLDWDNVFSLDLNVNTRTLPISPPAPHRRAPKPPTFTPRRRRGRHMPIREPALSGLFTVTEEAEPCSPVSPKASTRSTPESDIRIPSASASSECLAPSPHLSFRAENTSDFPQDVDMDVDMEEILLSDVDVRGRDRRASWESTDSRSSDSRSSDESLHVITPNLEEDDPFFSPSPFTLGRTAAEWPELSTPALVLPNTSEPAIAEPTPAQLPSLGSAFKLPSSAPFHLGQASGDLFNKSLLQLADGDSAHPFSAAALASTSTLPRDFGARSWSGNAPLFRRSAPPPPRLDLASDRRRLSMSPRSVAAKRQELLPPAEIISKRESPRTPTRSGPRPPKNRMASHPLQSSPEVRRAHHSLSRVLDGYHAIDPQRAFASLVIEAGESSDDISSASDTDDEAFAQLGMAFPLPPIRSSLPSGSPFSAKSSPDEPDTPWSADLRTPDSAKDGFSTPPLQYPRLKSAVMPPTPFVPLRKHDGESVPGRWQMSSHDVLQGWSRGSSTPSLVSSTGSASTTSAESWGCSLESSMTSRSSSSRRSGRLPKRGKLPTFA